MFTEKACIRDQPLTSRNQGTLSVHSGSRERTLGTRLFPDGGGPFSALVGMVGRRSVKIVDDRYLFGNGRLRLLIGDLSVVLYHVLILSNEQRRPGRGAKIKYLKNPLVFHFIVKHFARSI